MTNSIARGAAGKHRGSVIRYGADDVRVSDYSTEHEFDEADLERSLQYMKDHPRASWDECRDAALGRDLTRYARPGEHVERATTPTPGRPDLAYDDYPGMKPVHHEGFAVLHSETEPVRQPGQSHVEQTLRMAPAMPWLRQIEEIDGELRSFHPDEIHAADAYGEKYNLHRHEALQRLNLHGKRLGGQQD